MKQFLLLIIFPLFASKLHAIDTKMILKEDFTGDGIRDLAVWKADNGRLATWSIYCGQENGSYKYIYDLDFHPKAFRIYTSQQGTEFVFYFAGGAGKGMLITSHLDDKAVTNISMLQIEGGDSAHETHKQLYKKHFGYLITDPRTEVIPSSRLVEQDNVITIINTSKPIK
jgi:hypothetical protein